MVEKKDQGKENVYSAQYYLILSLKSTHMKGDG
jgi:hypothetical protein